MGVLELNIDSSYEKLSQEEQLLLDNIKKCRYEPFNILGTKYIFESMDIISVGSADTNGLKYNIKARRLSEIKIEKSLLCKYKELAGQIANGNFNQADIINLAKELCGNK